MTIDSIITAEPQTGEENSFTPELVSLEYRLVLLGQVPAQGKVKPSQVPLHPPPLALLAVHHKFISINKQQNHSFLQGLV